jgi:hypothetical protein
VPQIDPADREALARAYIAQHGDMPSPADCPAAARYAVAVAQATPAEFAQLFQDFRQTVASLPGGWLLLAYGSSLH